MGRSGARRAAVAGRHRIVPAAVRPVDARRRAADVHRRGAAAHSRCGHRRRADPRQARARRLGAPPRRVRFAARQRIDLGTDADRPADAHRPRRRARSARLVRALRRARRRAGRAARRAAGDEGDGRAVRARPHDRARPSREAAPPSRARTAIRTTCSARRRSPPPMPRATSTSYRDAIATIGAAARRAAKTSVFARPSISVKLSALHPRYEYPQRARVFAELVPDRARARARRAVRSGIGMTIDAEEAERLELSLELFARVRRDAGARRLARARPRRAGVPEARARASSATSWRSRASRARAFRCASSRARTGTPRSSARRCRAWPAIRCSRARPHTDVCYLACARALLEAGACVYPMFATHNAHTIAWVSARAAQPGVDAFEFQRLHGMGEALYRRVLIRQRRPHLACRVYAPVGGHRDLLPYLVRRLLENGANTSFVNRIGDPRVEIDDARRRSARPRAVAGLRAAHRGFRCRAICSRPSAAIPRACRSPTSRRCARSTKRSREARRRHWTRGADGAAMRVRRRARRFRAGRPAPQRSARVVDADWRAVDRALATLVDGQRAWDARRRDERAAHSRSRGRRASKSERAAVGRAAGARSRQDARAPRSRKCAKRPTSAATTRREARRRFDAPLALPSPTGESNTLALRGRGVFACISPWNFPLAIFTGQVAAALAAGNAVVAKPAEQTPLIAAQAVRTLHAAGVPADALALHARTGRDRSARDSSPIRASRASPSPDRRRSAALIAQALAARTPIVPLIAETGGQNAMIVDSSALAEQVVADVVQSAFDSAGPALLGAARAVPAGGHRAARARAARRRDGRARRSAIPAISPPTSAR